MSSVLIIFGSTGGNTELVTDKVAEVLAEKGHKIVVQRAEESKISDLKKYKYCLLAGSTYGQGLLQEHMKKFMKQFSGSELKSKKCAVIGLGDNKYNTEYVVEAAKILEKLVVKFGGELIMKALRINKTPVTYLNSTIKDWATKLSKVIK